MKYSDIVRLVETDPVVRTLLEMPIALRIGYTGLDGSPRVIPVVYLWDGAAFVFASPAAAYKVKSIVARPEAAFSIDVGPGPTAAEARVKISSSLGLPVVDYAPIAVTGRGTTSIEICSGIPQIHLEMARRMIGDDRKLKDWADGHVERDNDWAIISLTPTHIAVCDFVSRFPPTAELGP